MDQVSALIARVKAGELEPLIAGHLAAHLCVLLSGALELAIRDCIGRYAKAKAKDEIARLVISYLEEFQNPKPEKIITLFQRLGAERANTLETLWEGEMKDAIGSIVGNRHLIAHGRDTNVSLSRVSDWHASSVRFCEFLEAEFYVV